MSLRLPASARSPRGASVHVRRCGNALACALHAWILWTGSASALQSEAYGNVGPSLTWSKRGNYKDQAECVEARKVAVDAFLKSDPEAVKRRDDLVALQKTLPGENDAPMVAHTVIRYMCLTEDEKPPTYYWGLDNRSEVPR